MDLLFFTAPWCAPCRSVYPVLEKFQKANAAEVRLLTIDFDEQRAEAERWSVGEIPVGIAVSSDGRMLFRLDGADSEKLKKLAEELPKSLQRARVLHRQSSQRSRP